MSGYWRVVCLIGSPVWWCVAGSSSGWMFGVASLVAMAHTLPIAYWLGEGA